MQQTPVTILGKEAESPSLLQLTPVEQVQAARFAARWAEYLRHKAAIAPVEVKGLAAYMTDRDEDSINRTSQLNEIAHLAVEMGDDPFQAAILSVVYAYQGVLHTNPTSQDRTDFETLMHSATNDLLDVVQQDPALASGGMEFYAWNVRVAWDNYDASHDEDLINDPQVWISLLADAASLNYEVLADDFKASYGHSPSPAEVVLDVRLAELDDYVNELNQPDADIKAIEDDGPSL